MGRRQARIVFRSRSQRRRCSGTIDTLRSSPSTSSLLADESAVKASLLPAALLSADFRFIAVNSALAELAGVAAAQLRRRLFTDVVAAQDREGVRSFLESVADLQKSPLCQRELRVASAGDDRRNALLLLKRVGTAANPRYIANVVDLSAVAHTEDDRAELLRKIEDAAWEWRRTFDAVEMPLVIVGADGSLVRMNRAARMLAGRSYGEIIGGAIADLPHEEPWLSIADLTSRVREARAPAARQVRDSLGRTLDLLAMLFDADNPADGRVIVIAWDVSALVDLQSRLEQQRQMATMGALVAGVAHEVRNPLFAISATIDALEQAATADELQEYFEVLRHEIARMTTLMQDLLAYGRPAAPVFAEVPVKEIVEMAARACSALAVKQRVEIVVTSVDGVTVVADRDRLVRAVENLVLNAVQHSPQGGSVEVDATRHDGKRSGTVRIRVRDNGKGFAREDLPRVFEPFYSRRKGGTGLGLALVQQIVTEHGGELGAGNAEGGGAEVVITIPAKKTNAA